MNEAAVINEAAMINLLDLSDAISNSVGRRGLNIRNDLHEPGRTFWELRTLNRHRMVGLLSDSRKCADTQGLNSQLRSAVSRNFERA